MQGYYFSKPIPCSEFEKIICNNELPDYDNRFSKGIENAIDFLDVTNQDTLLFNSFLGGAGIFEYSGGQLVALRLNDKFIEACNNNWSEMEFYNKDAMIAFTKETQKDFKKMIEDSIKNDNEASCYTCYINPVNNEAKWFYNRIRCLANKVESYIMYVAIENVTERITLTENNKKLTRDLTALIENLPGGVSRTILTNGETYIDFAGEGLSKVLGYKHCRLLNILRNDPYSILYKEDYDRVMEYFTDLINNGTHFSSQHRLLCGDGKYRWFDVTGSLFGDKRRME